MKKNKPKRKAPVPPRKAKAKPTEPADSNPIIQQYIHKMVVHGSSNSRFAGAAASDSQPSGKKGTGVSPSKQVQRGSTQAMPPGKPSQSGRNRPSVGEKEFCGFVVNVDLANSESLVSKADQNAVPGTPPASVQFQAWCKSVWESAAKDSGIEKNDWKRRKTAGDGLCLVVKDVVTAHRFSVFLHQHATMANASSGTQSRWRFRVGIAKGVIHISQDVDGRPEFAGDAATLAERLQRNARAGGILICPQTFASLSFPVNSEYGQLPIDYPHPKKTDETVQGHPWPPPFHSRDDAIKALTTSLSSCPSPVRKVLEGVGLGNWDGNGKFVLSPSFQSSGDGISVVLEGVLRRLRDSRLGGEHHPSGLLEALAEPLGWILSLGLDYTELQKELDNQFDGKPMAFPSDGQAGLFKHPYRQVFIDVRVWIGAVLSGKPVPIRNPEPGRSVIWGSDQEPKRGIVQTRGLSVHDKKYEALLSFLEEVLPGATTPRENESFESYRERMESKVIAARFAADGLYREGNPIVSTNPAVKQYIEMIRIVFGNRVFVVDFTGHDFALVCRDHINIIKALLDIIEELSAIQR